MPPSAHAKGLVNKVGQIRKGVGGAIDVSERLKAAYESMDRLE
jgi:hypothetical protein